MTPIPYKTSKAEILFVDVPKGAKDFHIGDFTGNLKYYVGLLMRPQNIELPEGQWIYLCRLSEVSEEQAKILADSIEPTEGRICYRDFDGSSDEWLDKSDWFDTALESLQSLSKSLGLVNPVILIKNQK